MDAPMQSMSDEEYIPAPPGMNAPSREPQEETGSDDPRRNVPEVHDGRTPEPEYPGGSGVGILDGNIPGILCADGEPDDRDANDICMDGNYIVQQPATAENH